MFSLRGVLIFIVFFALSFQSIIAEKVIFKDGTILEGKVIRQTKDKIQLQFPDGTTRIIEKQDIDRIIYEKQPPKKEEPKEKPKPPEIPIKPEEPPKVEVESEIVKVEGIPTITQQIALPEKTKDTTGIYFKSIVFPGWGLMDLGKSGKGIAISSIFLASAFYYASTYQKTNDYRKLYKENTNLINFLVDTNILTPFTPEHLLMLNNISKIKSSFRSSTRDLSVAATWLVFFYFIQLGITNNEIQNAYYFDYKKTEVSFCDCKTLFSFTHTHHF
ncbi:MAG: hypothetical protein NZ853_03630 [Leptospiraceae bacterium]|nr:hypothetical protein [Leptospiraceae bacterium]MDW7975265.1 hypothetical protein [Leptospiraceae bacterium]